MQNIFNRVSTMGFRTYKVPHYETIYCGMLHGYAVTLFHFYYTGSLILCVNTVFATPEDEAAFQQFLLDEQVKERFPIQGIVIKDDFIQISWKISIDTDHEEDFFSFVDLVFPKLSGYHATRGDICTECGEKIPENAGCWCHINGSLTKHLHRKCCGSLARKVQQYQSFFPCKKIPTYKAGILGALLAVFPISFLWAYVFRFAEGGVVVTSLSMAGLAWFGYTFHAGFRGKLKPLIWLGASLLGITLGVFLLSLFGSARLLPADATPASVLIFISYLWALFMFAVIAIVEGIYYANEKRLGYYGVRILK